MTARALLEIVSKAHELHCVTGWDDSSDGVSFKCSCGILFTREWAQIKVLGVTIKEAREALRLTPKMGVA